MEGIEGYFEEKLLSVRVFIGYSKMSESNPEVFMSKHDEDTFYDLKKDELISLAEHLKLEVKKATRKHQIQHIIVKHLVNVKAFKETMLETMSQTYGAYDVEIKELQFELELKNLEMQERLEREERERQEELEREEKERQERREREERERQEKLEREERKNKKGWTEKKEKDKKSWRERKRKDKKRLKGYELVPEAYRQNFRNCEKVSSQTYVEFARSKEQLFDRWCHSQKVDKSHNRLRQLIMEMHSQ